MNTQITSPDASQTSTPNTSQDFTTRIFNVVRMQFIDRQWLVYTPYIILAVAFLITLAIFFIARIAGAPLEDMDKGLGYSWAIIAPMWYMPTAAIMAINPTIHIAFAYSVTRRDFYVGTIVAFITAAIVQGLSITLLVGIERVTGGYGFGLRFADANIYLDESLLNIFVIATLLYFSVMGISAAIAVMYLRWRVKGVLLSVLAIILVLLSVAFILALTGSWIPFGTWLVAQTTAIAFLWISAAALLAVLIGYLVIRRITPIN